MFLGCYSHQVDAKGRMRIPAQFRKSFDGDDVVAVKGSDKCIYIYTLDKLEEDLSGYVASTFANENREAGRIRRLISASSYPITQDSQDRFTISADLKKYAGITKDVVFLGNGNRIELWSKENWDEYSDGGDETYDDLLLALVPKSEDKQ